MRTHLIATTILAGSMALAVPAIAQGQGQGQGQSQGGQQPSAQRELPQGSQGQAQGGLPGQRLGQEQAQTQGTQIHVSPAAVRQVQQALNKKGYDVGNVDGTWNQSTKKAAQNFQQAQGLEPTGNLNIELLAALDMQSILQGQGGGQAAQLGQASGGLPGQRLGQEQAGQGGGQQGGGQQQAQGGGGQAGTPLHVSPAGIRQVQQALNKAGYDVGNVDGNWNQNTQKAVRNFQQAQGLEPNGQLDIALIAALGANQILQGTSGQGGGQAAGGQPGQRLAQEQAQSQGTPLYMSPAGVRQIKQALNKAGYDPGSVNGQWQQETQKALRNFQQANGLEPTGNLNTDTIAALGMGGLQQIAAGQGGGGQGATQAGGSGQPSQGQPSQGQGGASGQQRMQQGGGQSGASGGGQPTQGGGNTRTFQVEPKVIQEKQ